MKKLLSLLLFLVCVLSARADRFGTDATTTNNMNMETNYLIFVKGSDAESTVWKVAPSNALANVRIGTVGFQFDGNGSVPSVATNYIRMDYGGVITRASLISLDGNLGGAVVEVWRTNWASFTNGTMTADAKISASAPPTITLNRGFEDATLTGWGTTFAAGDVIACKYVSGATITKVQLTLRVRKDL